MSRVFAFRCWTERHPLPASTLVVFVSPDNFSTNALRDAIAEQTQNALSPEEIYILIAATNFEDYSEVLAKEPDIFWPIGPHASILYCSYDPRGRVLVRTGTPGWEKVTFPSDEVRRQGMATIFRRRNGLIEAGPTAHFVKPSGRADQVFLRAGNALVDGVEIFFVGLWLLPLLSDDVSIIHLDTSSIVSSVFAALLIRSSNYLPEIRSFESYAGMSSHKFRGDGREVILISASQSGKMSEQLFRLAGNQAKIATLFTTSPESTTGMVLCDLSYDELRNPNGINRGHTRKVNLGSRPIRVIGEQFATDIGASVAIMPGLPHSPTVVSGTLQKIQGAGIFFVNRTGKGQSKPKAIWVETSCLRRTAHYRKWLERVVVSMIPAVTKAIIYPDHGPDARGLADDVYSELGRHGADLTKIRLISFHELEDEARSESGFDDFASVVIAGDATGHGEELLAVSRALRQWAPNSYRLFLSPATIPSSARAFQILHSNLVQPQHRFETFFFLPVNREYVAESWDLERRLLSDRQDEIPDELSSRLDELNMESAGMYDNLFLRGVGGHLKLRRNFAFWPSVEDCKTASQSDLFVTVAVILENMRSGSGFAEDRRLVNNATQQSVLSASTFSRFNDGIIQAAFLRAARPVELNYSDATDDSRLLVKLIIEMCDLADRPQAEALSEFLLAIATGRLQFAHTDKLLLIEKLQSVGDRLTESQTWLSSLVVQNLLR
jgi:hypothetical protein